MLTIYFDESLKNKQVINLPDTFFKENYGKLDKTTKDIAHDVSHGRYFKVTLIR